jgi:synaptic vesicle membrane protein VAT-1
MLKVVIHSPGGYEKLRLEEHDDPQPSEFEVCIDVHFAGVNYADSLVRRGVYESAKKYVGWPITPGFEVSGVVSKVGKAVSQFQPGDQVLAFTRFNGYSSLLVVHETQVIGLPASFSIEQGAAFPATYMTAFYSLFQIFKLPPSSLLLIHSAAGGVGSALTILAKIAGHHVVGVVGQAQKLEYAKDLGADFVYDKSSPDFTWKSIFQDHPQGFDAAYDANGYTTLRVSYDCLRETGKLVAYGSHSLLPREGGKVDYLKAIWGLLRTPRFNPLNLISDNKSIIGFNLSFLFEQKSLIHETLEGLSQKIQGGKLTPPQVKMFPVEDVAKAHSHIESGSSIGKIVLQFR